MSIKLGTHQAGAEQKGIENIHLYLRTSSAALCALLPSEIPAYAWVNASETREAKRPMGPKEDRARVCANYLRRTQSWSEQLTKRRPSHGAMRHNSYGPVDHNKRPFIFPLSNNSVQLIQYTK